MKITITRKDWKRGLDYHDPCGCLVARAVKRKTGIRWVSVWPIGSVNIKGRNYLYHHDDVESDIQAAHRDPSLLPITIELR